MTPRGFGSRAASLAAFLALALAAPDLARVLTEPGAAAHFLSPAWAEKSSKRARSSSSSRPTMKRTEKKVEGGTHWRIQTRDHGPIHVWIPPGYDRTKAGLVIYVHGYRVSADDAWKEHNLAEQFRKSRQHAMFLVIEAPKSNEERVYWDSLADLKKAVRSAGMRLPDGHTVAIAHSGGFRTISGWVDNKRLNHVILLDAMYGHKDKFEEFIHSGKRAKDHKMVIVAASTSEESKKFAQRFRRAVVRGSVPDTYSEFTASERKASLLYIRSQYGHGAIADGGKVLPLMLRLTRLAHL